VVQPWRVEVFKEHLTTLLVSLGSSFFLFFFFFFFFFCFFFCGEIVFIPKELFL
jgi:hypothetical protein